ncbi:MAG: hypothetical protein IKC46_09720 [Lachnospiraceae bacterium]|nr:hypothetical protein [Lachnospiraceae bacterium]
MAKEKKKPDLLNDPMWKVILSIGLPLVLTSLISIATAAISNEILSKYVGAVYFTVAGYIGMITSIYVTVVNSVVSGAWIRTAKFYSQTEKAGFNSSTANGIYAILAVQILCMLLLLLGRNWIMKILSIPAEILADVKTYYVIYMISYMIVPVGGLIVMIVNGIASVTDIFIVNCINTCGTTVMAAVILILFRGGLSGTAILPASNSVLLLAVSFWLLKKHGCRVRLSFSELKPDFKLIGSIIRYGFLIALQNAICSLGYMLVTVQTNKHLDADYISVLSVGIPLIGVMTALATVCTVVVPPNYEAGKMDRVRQFLKISWIGCVANGVFAWAVYALLGEWYYGRLFDDPVIIAYGKDYWMYYGIGFVLVAFLHAVRFFFDAVGYSKLALISGVGELIGCIISAYILIPVFGPIGRTLSYPLGWFFAAMFLTIAYIVFRKKIYGPQTNL